MIDTQIAFPKYKSKDAVFLVMMLKGHTLWLDNLPQLTGLHDAPNIVHRLIKLGVPIKTKLHPVKPKYKNLIAFYSVDYAMIAEMVGQERLEGFIERVVTHWDFDEAIKKGLQSKPQPLQSILAGKLLNGGDL